MKNFKKTFLIFCLCLPVFWVNANLLPSPDVGISELFFDKNSNWYIELEYKKFSDPDFGIDSIFICSESGKSEIKCINLVGENGLIVVNNDSLKNNLTINPEGDCITVVFYIRINDFNIPVEKKFIFGNYPNAKISKLKEGQSYARIPFNGICFDNTPTIGFANDTSGVCGTLKGKVYNIKNQLIKNCVLSFDDGFKINTNSEGEYSTRLVSRNFSVNITEYNVGLYNQRMFITPLEFNIVPDTIVDRNIYIESTLLSILENYKNDIIKIYPNPLYKNFLSLQTNQPIHSLELKFSIFNMSGIKVLDGVIDENYERIELPGRIVNGSYIIQFYLTDKIIQTNKLQIAR